jgi:hypothetical protein
MCIVLDEPVIELTETFTVTYTISTINRITQIFILPPITFIETSVCECATIKCLNPTPAP